MRTVRTLAVAAALAALAMPCARAADGRGWAELSGRIASADASSAMHAALGVEPSGFAYPFPVHLGLRVAGSTWSAPSRDGTAGGVHIYYVPARATTDAAVALSAALRTAHYVSSGLGDQFLQTFGAASVVRYCPSDRRSAEFDVGVTLIDRVAALDVRTVPPPLACNASAYRGNSAYRADPRVPDLGRIDGVGYHQRLSAMGVESGPLRDTSTLESALPFADVVARIGERFTGAGWKASPPSV